MTPGRVCCGERTRVAESLRAALDAWGPSTIYSDAVGLRLRRSAAVAVCARRRRGLCSSSFPGWYP
jgi:hypothetical protein